MNFHSIQDRSNLGSPHTLRTAAMMKTFRERIEKNTNHNQAVMEVRPGVEENDVSTVKMIQNLRPTLGVKLTY